MSAGDAGVAQGDGQNGQGEGAETQQGPDVSALAEQLGTYGQNMEQMRETLQGMQQFMAQQQTPAEPEGQAPELDLSFLDDPQLTPEQLSQQFTSMLDQGVEQRFQQALQQHLSPLQDRVSNMQLTQEAIQLTDEYPELRKPDVAGDVIEASRQYAEMLGQPELANNPMLWRLVYMGIKAADVANTEGGESPDAAHLEGAGGAGPGGQQVDLVQQIMQGGDDSALGRRVLPF
jgi:hypothetical protein